VADLVHDLRLVAGREESGLEVGEDPFDPTVAGRGDRLDTPSDEENPHAFPSPP
jgi:hypothetical protein